MVYSGEEGGREWGIVGKKGVESAIAACVEDIG